jgi:hypothetical protein
MLMKFIFTFFVISLFLTNASWAESYWVTNLAPREIEVYDKNNNPVATIDADTTQYLPSSTAFPIYASSTKLEAHTYSLSAGCYSISWWELGSTHLSALPLNCDLRKHP